MSSWDMYLLSALWLSKVLWEESRARNGDIRNPSVYVTTDKLCDFSKLFKLSYEVEKPSCPPGALLPHLNFGHPAINSLGGFEALIICWVCGAWKIEILCNISF